MRRLAVAFALLLLCVVRVAAQESRVPIPQLNSPVTDLTGTFNDDQANWIRKKLLNFQQQKGAQVAVLMLPSTRPEEIEQYSIRVVESWKLGRAKVDDGLLLIIALNDHALRIEVAYGLEGVMTDLVSKRIIDDIIVPYFRAGDYFRGVDAGVDAILKVVSGEALPEPTGQNGGGQDDAGVFIFPLVIITAIGTLFREALGPGKAAAISALLAAVAASFFLPIIVACLAGLAVYILVLAGAVGGGSGGGGSYSSSGGSGYSYGGGGGRFGGGGASGRW